VPRRIGVTRETGSMLYWLVGNCELFGYPVQNWMLVAAGALALYVLMLAVTRQRANSP
jgi:hypothetical protein